VGEITQFLIGRGEELGPVTQFPQLVPLIQIKQLFCCQQSWLKLLLLHYLLSKKKREEIGGNFLFVYFLLNFSIDKSPHSDQHIEKSSFRMPLQRV
jgi:hypothetical protein